MMLLSLIIRQDTLTCKNIKILPVIPVNFYNSMCIMQAGGRPVFVYPIFNLCLMDLKCLGCTQMMQMIIM